jgi:hypothetical protein
LIDSLDGLCSRELLLEAYLRDLADTDRSLARQIANCSNSFANTGPTSWRVRLKKHRRRVHWVPTTSPISFASSSHRGGRSRRCRCAIRSCAIWSPIPVAAGL